MDEVGSGEENEWGEYVDGWNGWMDVADGNLIKTCFAENRFCRD